MEKSTLFDRVIAVNDLSLEYSSAKEPLSSMSFTWAPQVYTTLSYASWSACLVVRCILCLLYRHHHRWHSSHCTIYRFKCGGHFRRIEGSFVSPSWLQHWSRFFYYVSAESSLNGVQWSSEVHEYVSGSDGCSWMCLSPTNRLVNCTLLTTVLDTRNSNMNFSNV